MLKKLLLGVVVLLLVLTGVSYLFPRHVAVARSAQIAATPDAIYPLLATPAEWNRWSPWNKRDSNMTITYSGPASGAGARWDWKSESQGDGGMVFTNAVPMQSIDYELVMVGMGPPSYGSFVLTPNDQGTLVTWDMTMDMGNTPMGRWFGLYMPTMLGKDFEDGLRDLGAYASTRPPG